MPRRREVPKREILPDPKFGSVDLSKFMNVIMEAGKKAIAERIIYGALDQIEHHRGLCGLAALPVLVAIPGRKSTKNGNECPGDEITVLLPEVLQLVKLLLFFEV